MAVPSDLTSTLIVKEAFKKLGEASPHSTQVTRAESYFLREIINDIWTRKDKYDNPVKYKILQTTDVQVTTIGVSKYAMDTDFDDDISISFLTGTHYDTATAAAASTITLAADEDATEEEVEGNYILQTGGTNSPQISQCTDYNTTTLVATVSPAWPVGTPSGTITYRIIDNIIDLEEDSVIGLGSLGSSMAKGIPAKYAMIIEDEYTYVLLDKPPDASTYGLFERYYANPNALDLTSSVMTRIYNNWQNALTLGVASKLDMNFSKEYEKAVAQLIAKETPASGEFKGFTL